MAGVLYWQRYYEEWERKKHRAPLATVVAADISRFAERFGRPVRHCLTSPLDAFELREALSIQVCSRSYCARGIVCLSGDVIPDEECR